MKTLLKTSLLSTFALFALAAGLSAKIVGSGNVTTETRKITGFHAIELRSSGSVVVTQGDTEGMVIEAEDNVLPAIITEVSSNGVLQIGFKAGEEIRLSKPLVFKVAVKTLDSLVIAGSGSISSRSLKADHFNVHLLGSGNFILDGLELNALTVAIDGSGDLKLAGKARSQTVNVNGSGDYEAAALKTAVATVNIAGSGDCEVAASETLGVEISGSGDVSYYGKPTVTKHVSGSGSVDAMGAGK